MNKSKNCEMRRVSKVIGYFSSLLNKQGAMVDTTFWDKSGPLI